jgi:hypothetical protein
MLMVRHSLHYCFTVRNFPPESPIAPFSLCSALYVVLFLFSIHTLRRQIPAGKTLRVTAWAMFLLASASTIVACLAAGTSMHLVHTVVEGSQDTPTHVLRHYHALRLGQDIILAMNKSVHPLPSLFHANETEKKIV